MPENTDEIATSVDGRLWVFSPVYWTFVGHEQWRAELPTRGLRAARVEAVFQVVASHTTGSSSQAYTLVIGG